MRLHVFQHVPFEGPAEVARWARERGHALTSTHWYTAPHTPPDLATVDGLLVLGGPMNIYEHRPHPWLRAEKNFISRALENGRPVIGLCLGAQLLADVLGGKVYQNPLREIGWWPVRWRTETRETLGWDFLPKTSTPLHWHGDTFDLPPRAQWLAESDDCANQAFAWGRLALGLQFHLEANNESLTGLLDHCGHELEFSASRKQTPEQIVAGLTKNQKNNLPLLWKILDKWFG